MQQFMTTRHTATTYPLHRCSSAAILSQLPGKKKHSAASQVDQVDPALSPTERHRKAEKRREDKNQENILEIEQTRRKERRAKQKTRTKPKETEERWNI